LKYCVAELAEHDGHDCPSGSQSCSDSLKLSTADNWLKTNLGPLLSSALFQKDGLLAIVFDEVARMAAATLPCSSSDPLLTRLPAFHLLPAPEHPAPSRQQHWCCSSARQLC
jgi:hypothetical protein